MARGRPALATVLMATGVIALAVPGSTAFAGEFAILAGVFQQGWGYAVVGAVAIVLAAMYVLRMISAVLHTEAGAGGVATSALDLRRGELAIVVPLVAILLVLSAWPAAISERVTGSNLSASIRAHEGVAVVEEVIASIPRPPIDWFAISPWLSLLAAAGVCLMVAVLVPTSVRKLVAASVAAAGFIAAFVFAALALRPERNRQERDRRRRPARPARRAGGDHRRRRRARRRHGLVV